MGEIKKLVVVLALLVGGGGVYGDELARECRQPPRPAIPDGDTASEDDLLGARTELQSYLAAGDKYLACLRDVEKGLGEDIAVSDAQMLVQMHNKMVDDMYLAGDEFNIALRKFKRQ